MNWLNRNKPGYNLTPRTLANTLSHKNTEFLRLYNSLIQLVIHTSLRLRYGIRIFEVSVLCIRTLEETLLGALELGAEEIEDDCCEAWLEEILDDCLSIIRSNVREYQTHLFHLRRTRA